MTAAAAPRMGRIIFGRLTEAWKGEAADFTPLLAAQLDQLGEAIGIDLAAIGESEVSTAGGRRIDVVAQGSDGSEFVIENQYGKADHDHLTRGLAYAVARQARGLIVVAEEHRDEFRAVAGYLNDLAEHDPARAFSVWLVEARAARIGNSEWAPLFSAVVEPNAFTTSVEQTKQAESYSTVGELLGTVANADLRRSIEAVLDRWTALKPSLLLGRNYVTLRTPGPAASGLRTVASIYTDGAVLIPFSAYEGSNSGIAIDSLSTPEFRAQANGLFGFNGTEKLGRTPAGWLTASRAQEFADFCDKVAAAFLGALPS